jgi:hypothetical protein
VHPERHGPHRRVRVRAHRHRVQQHQRLVHLVLIVAFVLDALLAFGLDVVDVTDFVRTSTIGTSSNGSTSTTASTTTSSSELGRDGGTIAARKERGDRP